MATSAPAHEPVYRIGSDDIDVEHVPALLPAPPSALLVGLDGQKIKLTAGEFEVLSRIHSALQQRRAVQIVTYENDLTTQEAADILNISRQYLVKLLDRGEIAHTKVGTHRRVRLQDVLDYHKRRSAGRTASLRRLTQMSQETGDY